MAMSISLAALVLAVLAAIWTCNAQTFEEAQETLNSIPFDQLDEGTGMEGEASDYIFDLWLDIEEAFKFLQEKQTAEEIRRLRMKEISKRFPFRHHNFIRFGKRSAATPNLLQVSRNVPASPSEEYTKGSAGGKDNKISTTTFLPYYRITRSLDEDEATDVAKRPYSSFVRFGRSSEVLDKAKRPYSSFVRFGRSSEASDRAKRPHHSFVRIGRSIQAPAMAKRPYSSFIRIGRSVGTNEDRSSSSTNPLDLPENPKAFDRFSTRSLPISLRGYGNARIGRLPAALFFHRPSARSYNRLSRPSSSSSSRLHVNSLPRYG